MAIKNIILDLGGVILNIDYQLTIDAFKKLGIRNFDALFTQAKQEHLFDYYEAGKIDSNEFIKRLEEYLDTEQSSTEIIRAWNTMLLDLPMERLSFIDELRENYNTALLSNTNPIHIECFHRIIRENNKIDSLDPYFDHVHFSSDLGMRKPDPKIFSHVCELHNYKPEETLFIDDSIQHVEGAKKAGLHAHFLDTKTDNIINLLTTLLTKLN